jgi:hypothetical protein
MLNLKDGRILSVPYTWFPRLIGASSELLNRYELSGNGEGIHWQEHPESSPFNATEGAA